MAALYLESSGAGGPSRLLIPGKSATNPGFSENSEVCLRSDIQGLDFFIDDAPIVGSTDGPGCRWKWKPGFHAGTVRAELIEVAKNQTTEYYLDVSPDPSKMGQDLIKGMIREVLEFDARLLLGDEPARIALGQEGWLDDPSLGLARIFQHGGAFLAALRAVEWDPQRSIRQTRRLMKPEGLRRIDAQTIRASISSGLISYLDPEFQDQRSGPPHPIYFDVPVSETTLDNSANRALAGLAHEVLNFARKIRVLYGARVEKEEENTLRTSLKVRWPRRKMMLDQFILDLEGQLRREPLGSISSPGKSVDGMITLSANPKYGNARRIAWKMTRLGVLGVAQEELPWMSPTWHVYEAWCASRLCDGLRQGIPEFHWSRHLVGPGRFAFLGKLGEARISLHYQPYFRPSKSASTPGGFCSISDTFIPDLVLTVENGETKQWYVFDAKYSSSFDSLKLQMRSAHLYHDALRWSTLRPSKSILLVPAISPEAAWMSEEGFIQAHGVGISQFVPGTPFEDKVIAETREFFGV